MRKQGTTRRGFLAWLGIGGVAAAAGRSSVAADPVERVTCKCPVQVQTRDALFGGGELALVHLSRECPIHAEAATGGCGVYQCHSADCSNYRIEDFPEPSPYSLPGDPMYGIATREDMRALCVENPALIGATAFPAE